MMIKSKQKFWDKLFMFCMILLIIKLVSILISFFYLPAKEVFLDLLLYLCASFIILLAVAVMSNSGFASGNGRLFGSGSAVVGDELFTKFYRKYNDAAEQYIKQKEYKKAANIYLKLLQNPYKAAKTLENGKLYSEAAVIYLKKLEDKNSAANCYQKAMQYGKAIPLYLENEQFEKVGDLYKLQNNIVKAQHFYSIVIDGYVQKNQFLKASLVYRNKIESPDAAQKILLQGWEKNQDAYNCLNNYFENINEAETAGQEIDRIYKGISPDKKVVFLKVIKIEYSKKPALQDQIKDTAYKIISERSEKIPSFISELQFFQKHDLIISKDIALYQSSKSIILK